MKKIQFIVLFWVLGISGFAIADDGKSAVENIIKAYYSQLESTIQNNDSALSRFIGLNNSAAGTLSKKICLSFDEITGTAEKCRALYILGTLKHYVSISTLVKHIDFHRPHTFESISKDERVMLITEIPMIEQRPAVQALVAIGPLCIPKVTKEFLATKDAERRRWCLETIFRILMKGFSREEALETIRLIVKKRIEKSPLPNKEQLLEELNNYKPF
jgi:hypothetical protein